MLLSPTTSQASPANKPEIFPYAAEGGVVAPIVGPGAPAPGDDLRSTLLNGHHETAVSPRIRFMSADEIGKRARLSWLIDGLLEEGAVSVLVGRPSTYKTFIALDMALSVAAGIPWHGRHVSTGLVAYIVAEGAQGLQERVGAWELAHRVKGLGCRYWPEGVQLTVQKEVDELVRGLDLLEVPPKLVVVDTMARCFVGRDENTAKDVGGLIAGIDRIRVHTGGAVLVVHHCGKDGKPRGSTALSAAANTEILVERRKGAVILTCSKQKNAEEFDAITFRPETVTLSETASSLVLREADCHRSGEKSDDPAPRQTDLSRRDKEVLAVLSGFGDQGATFSDWEEAACRELSISESTFSRARRKLEKQDAIALSDNIYRCSADDGW